MLSLFYIWEKHSPIKEKLFLNSRLRRPYFKFLKFYSQQILQ